MFTVRFGGVPKNVPGFVGSVGGIVADGGCSTRWLP
jgi:hypothetical protein